MLLDHQLVPQAIAKPNSFVGLMSLYESNFLRLLRLIPELERLDGCYRSRVAGECDLFVEFLERCRYTVTLSLTHRFDSSRGAIADPDMVIRAYLDCELTEAVSIGARQQQGALQRLIAAQTRDLDTRWKRNVVLNKWLDYLSDQGHLVLERF